MYEKLIADLREDAEWAEANEWETPITLADHLKQAAEVIASIHDDAVQGKWIRQRITFTSDAEIFLCSACTDISFRASRFCPNCGAKMREAE